MLLTLTLSLLIGLLLGLLGGGGSILTLPMLVYVLAVDAKSAVLTSFVVVGLSSLMALIPHARRSSVCWKSGLMFGVSGMTGSYSSAQLAAHFSSSLLMCLFGLISLVTGLLMLLGKPRAQVTSIPRTTLSVCPLNIPFLRVLFDGFWVGAVTGLVGVGGGFLIVPALTLLVGLPMQGAVGTSLLIIFMNAAAGLLGYSQHADLNLPLTGLVASGAIIGSALGGWASDKINPAWLRRGFALMVLAVAVYVLTQSINLQFIDAVQVCLSDPQILQYLALGFLVGILIVTVGYWIHKTERVMLTPI